MRSVVILAILSVAFASASFEFDNETGAHYSFDHYVKDFNKKYSKSQSAMRKKVFAENLQKIMKHNSSPSSYRMGVNKFTDMTDAERRQFLGSGVVNAEHMLLLGERKLAELPSMDPADLPASVDWRTVKPSIITPPKDQSSCGSCWAHGATECIESFAAMASGKLLRLSRQSLVDCAPNPDDCGGTGGCQGSTAELAFNYVASAGGIATEQAYPYTAANGQCKTNVKKAATVTGWNMLPNNNYSALVQAVATIGPLAINADASSWFAYSSGVFDGCTFDNIDINHVIQLVGYGTDAPSGQDYWLVRNSWSANWGEGGYLRIQKHSDGNPQWCGPDTRPQDGVGCNGGPSVVTVCGSCGIWFDTSYPIGASVL